MQAWIPIVGPALLSLAGVLAAWFVKRTPIPVTRLSATSSYVRCFP